jgi:hypothetical protein
MAEQMQASSPVPVRIPRYIGNLNALAVDAGLTVEMEVGPYSNGSEIRLWSNWRGAQATFLALVQPVASYRLPLSRGRLNIPGGAGYYAPNALVSGDVIVSGTDVLFQIDFGPPEFTIADAAGVEIVSYADETLYHGSPAALMALGIERSRLPLQKKKTRGGRDWKGETQEWRSRRQPDGSIVYRVESPTALRRRRSGFEEYADRMQMGSPRRVAETKARPSHLRLVIDNSP